MDNVDIRSGFKKTELGNFPLDWEIMKLERISEVRGGCGFPTHYQGIKEGEIPFYKVSDMNMVGNEVLMVASNNYIDYSTLKSLKTKIFPKETIIFPKIGAAIHTNKKRILSKNSLVDNNIMGLNVISRDKCFPEFLFYYMNIVNLSDLSNPGPLPSITAQTIKNFEIPLPPLAEQQRIAYVLSTVQKAMDKTKAVIEAARGMKKSLMKHFFTYGPVTLEEAGKVLLKETDIGIVPGHWEVIKLGNVASNVRSGSTPRGGSTTYLNKGIPFIRSQNVLMNCLFLDNVAYISNETHELMLRSQIQPGDVLLNITGASIGRVAIAPSTLKEANVNQHVCRIKPKDGLISEFLSYYLASEMGQWQIMSTQIGATRQGLNYQQVRSFSIPMPSLEEQTKIAESLAAIDLKVRAENMQMAALDTLFKTLLNNLMTGKIRVNHLEMVN